MNAYTHYKQLRLSVHSIVNMSVNHVYSPFDPCISTNYTHKYKLAANWSV